MYGLNKALLIGNVGRDPDVHYTDSGVQVVNFTMATGETWKDRDGNQQERTEWHRIVAYAKLAEVIAKYVTKGKPLYIEGRIQTNKWQGQDGQDRYTTEIVAQKMVMLGRGSGAPDGDDDVRDGYGEGPQTDRAGTPGPSAPQHPDSDIPF